MVYVLFYIALTDGTYVVLHYLADGTAEVMSRKIPITYYPYLQPSTFKVLKYFI